jgi:4-oxalocrotonate tautomerase
MPAVTIDVIKDVFTPKQKTGPHPQGDRGDGRGRRPRTCAAVTWVRIQEFEGGDWAIGGKPLTAADVHALAAASDPDA